MKCAEKHQNVLEMQGDLCYNVLENGQCLFLFGHFIPTQEYCIAPAYQEKGPVHGLMAIPLHDTGRCPLNGRRHILITGLPEIPSGSPGRKQGQLKKKAFRIKRRSS